MVRFKRKCKSGAAEVAGWVAVSYTHLDVYKRQIINISSKINTHLVTALLLNNHESYQLIN